MYDNFNKYLRIYKYVYLKGIYIITCKNMYTFL